MMLRTFIGVVAGLVLFGGETLDEPIEIEIDESNPPTE